MKKETRANLLFLAIFLAISLPGGVILFKKKLDPSLRPSYLPPAAPTRLTYVDPREAPSLRRYVPPKTGHWVAQLAGARGVASILSRDGIPVMSATRSVQVVGIAKAADVQRLTLLIWRPARDVRVDEQVATPEAAVDVPEDVRRELILSGFANPPRQATWVTASVSNPADAAGSRTLNLKIDGQNDTVTIFTN